MKKMDVSRRRRNFGAGFLLAGMAAGFTAIVAAVMRQKQRERVYHEAEIKAMNELDDLMAEDEGSYASDTLDDLGEQVEMTADKVQDMAADAQDTAKEAAKTVKETVEDAKETVEDAVEKAKDTIDDAVDDSTKK